MKPFLYRDHRGSLDSSMETVQEMHSANQLRKHVYDIFGDGQVTVEEYGGVDERIGWDTHLVCWEGGAIGMTNAMVDMNFAGPRG